MLAVGVGVLAVVLAAGGAAFAATLPGKRVGRTLFTALGGVGAGADGNLWFTAYRRPQVGRLDVRTGAIRKFVGLRRPAQFGVELVPDGRGNLWTFMLGGAPDLARISRTGAVTNVTSGAPGPIAWLGPGVDRAVWFSHGSFGTALHGVGRLDRSGRATELARTSGFVSRPTPGRDGRRRASGRSTLSWPARLPRSGRCARIPARSSP